MRALRRVQNPSLSCIDAAKSHVAAAEAMTTAKATPVAAAAGTDQNEWAARCTPWLLLLGVAEIARLCERRGVRESKCKKCRDQT